MAEKLNRSMSLRHLIAMKFVLDLNASPFEKSSEESVNGEGGLFVVRDSMPGSPYYFRINSIDTTSSSTVDWVRTEQVPKDHLSVSPDKTSVEPKNLQTYYNKWVNLVSEYNSYFLKYQQDTIIEGYEADIDFELPDEDADTHSYAEPKQVIIDTYLHKVADQLRQYKETLNLGDEINEEIDTILADIERLRATQHRQTKRQVYNKVINIVARCKKAIPVSVRKLGSELGRTIMIDELKQLLLETGPNLLDQGMKMLDP